VWQKSNETDFLLTMKFIHLTNQGYPLQNSSLGQLHSDGGVVSIVRSSANLYTKFDGTTLLTLLPVHFLNAPHKHSLTSDALNNRVATVASSNLY